MTNLSSLISRIGHATAWLTLAMVLLMGINVLMRYAFAAGEPWQQEAVRFMHAVIFLIGGAYAYSKDQHVRVDVFYQRMSEKGKAWVNLCGVCLCLLPLCGALLYFSYDYVTSSWAILEGSNEYRGMPGVFLLKSCIWVCAGLLLLQSAVIMKRCWLVIARSSI